jgi:hypothetical protein
VLGLALAHYRVEYLSDGDAADATAGLNTASPEELEKASTASFLPLGRRSKVQSSQMVWNRSGMDDDCITFFRLLKECMRRYDLVCQSITLYILWYAYVVGTVTVCS